MRKPWGWTLLVLVLVGTLVHGQQFSASGSESESDGEEDDRDEEFVPHVVAQFAGRACVRRLPESMQRRLACDLVQEVVESVHRTVYAGDERQYTFQLPVLREEKDGTMVATDKKRTVKVAQLTQLDLEDMLRASYASQQAALAHFYNISERINKLDLNSQLGTMDALRRQLHDEYVAGYEEMVKELTKLAEANKDNMGEDEEEEDDGDLSASDYDDDDHREGANGRGGAENKPSDALPSDATVPTPAKTTTATTNPKGKGKGKAKPKAKPKAAAAAAGGAAAGGAKTTPKQPKKKKQKKQKK